jgi:transposase InsO family protein
VRAAFDSSLISSDGELLLLREAVYLHELTDGFKVERVSDEWIDFYNTERPHSALAGWTPYGAGQPVDMMDKARALRTSPQVQPQQLDEIDRVLAA